MFALAALPERVHVNAIGSFRPTMRELPNKLIETAELVVVDQLAAATAEAGEVIHALQAGSIALDDVRELSAVRDTPPRTTGRTVFKTGGVAPQDWAIARLLAQRYRQLEPTWSDSTGGPNRAVAHLEVQPGGQ